MVVRGESGDGGESVDGRWSLVVGGTVDLYVGFAARLEAAPFQSGAETGSRALPDWTAEGGCPHMSSCPHKGSYPCMRAYL